MIINNIYKMSMDYVKEFYSQPQAGGGFSVYSGTRRQIGGSFLSGLARFALPILKFLGRKALNIGKNVATDVIVDKKPLKQSVETRIVEEAKKTLKGRGVKRGRILRNGGMSRLGINKSSKARKVDIFSNV